MTIRNSTRARLLACSALSVLTLGMAAQGAEAQVVIDGGDTVNVPADTGPSWAVGSLTVGQSSAGTLNISGGALVSSTGQQVLGLLNTADGFVTIDGADSRWINTGGGFIIGLQGHGDLRITNGGVLSNTGEIRLGGNAGASAYVSVDGAGSALISTSQINVGYWDAPGVLQISNGGALSAASIGLGMVGTSDGTLIIGSDDLLNPLAPGADIEANIIGGAGSGEIFLNHTGTTTISGNILGTLDLTSHSGTTILTGSNSTYSGDTVIHGGELIVEGELDQSTNNFWVGEASGDDGSFIIRNGGLVTNRATYIANQAGSRGEVTVTGDGSLWTTGDIYVGQRAEGYLTVSDGGGVATTGIGSIARSADAFASGTGVVTVTGEDSFWTMTGGLYVGAGLDGDGYLAVEDGGEVSNAWGHLGRVADSRGEVLVTGAGSLWSSTGFVWVGGSGDGVLTVADGGVAHITGGAATLTLGAEATGSGILNFGSAEGVAAVAAGSVNAAEIVFGVGGGEIVFNHTGSTTLDADISGDGVLKFLSGTTVLSGDNSFTGESILDDAILTLASDTALGGSTLRMTGSVLDYADGVNSAAPIIIDSNTSQFQVLTGSATQSGVISQDGGSRPFEKIGAGELVLTADNTWTGLTTVRAGTLAIEGANDQGAGGYYVGRFDGDEGALILRGGGTIDSGSVTLGYESGAVGEATVTGSGSVWDASSSHFRVGEEGEGVLTISGGGVVRSFYGIVGLREGGSGVATVTGTDSTWAVTSEFGVGSAGQGTLTISDGGSISSGQGVIGGLENAVGQVTVTGTDSSWTNGGTLYVGFEGQADLIITGEATVSNTVGYIGTQADSAGTVSVTGADSLWANSSVLYVGASGSGALQIADEGVVQAGGGVGLVRVGWNAGSAGLLTIGAWAGDDAVGAGSLEASEVRFGAGTGTLVFNHTETDYDFDVLITGDGQIDVLAGFTTLTNDNTAFTGDTTVDGGDLRIADILGGDVTVSSGSLGGGGSILGAVSVGAGSLIGAAGSVLTMGSLVLDADSIVDVTLDAPDTTALFDVTGDLVLDGTLDVTDAGAFGPGIYRLFDYGGTLTDNGLEIGDPGGAFGPALAVQTGDAGQINLAYLDDLLFWDGAGPADDGTIQGGDGTWTAVATNWTDLNGDDNGPMLPQPGFAVFLGTGGAVTVDDADGAVEITGAQFAVDGYAFSGDALGLVAPGAGQPVILRVGDGTAAGAAMIAQIGNDLSGAVSLIKTDLGELILSGANTWTGDTTVEDGQLTLRGGSITNTGTLYVEGVSDLAGMLVDAGGQVTVGGVSVGGASGGELTVSGSGSRLETTGSLTNSGVGSASVVVEAGASLHAESIIQFDSAALASLIVTGSGSLLTGGNALNLGVTDAAVLLVDDDGRVETVGGFLGLLGGAYGQATLQNGGVWAAEELFIGYMGEGHVQAFDGGSLQIAVGVSGGNGSLELGSLAGGYGILEIRNASASIENTLWVGRGGDGIVFVDEDGVLQTGSTVIAEETDSTSTAIISGGQWTNTGEIIIGEFGWGDLFAEAGGSLITGDAVLGLEEDSFGTTVISDAATSWLVNGGLTVGDAGEGALQVRDGAVVTGGAGRAAVGDFSFAEIWLTEDGVLNLDSLTLGEEGEAHLTLTDGGTLTLNGGTGVLTLGADAAGYGVLTIGGVGCGCLPGAPDAAGVLNAAEVVFGPGAGELYFNHTDTDYAFGAELTGTGLVAALSGTTRLTGDSADFTGQIMVFGPDARLLVDGLVGGDPLTSLTVVADGARLGGSGTLDQYVVIDADGILEGRSGQVLTLGNLMLGPDAIVEASLGAPGADVLFDVTGDLTLDGELHVVDLGGFGAGLYGLFSYGGLLTDDGLDITSAPGSVNLSDLSLQITGDRVNLINTAGLTVTFWDGGDLAVHDNAAVDGGDGTWTATSAVWTDGMGLLNGAMDPAPGFAVFSGSAGTVTADDVDGALTVTGMQFAVDGYSLIGDAIELAPAGGDPAIIRVGDGTAAGAAMTAVIASDLTGTALLRKTDLGTLILTGDAAHTGGTEIAHGELHIGDGGTTGSLIGDVANEGVLVFNRSDDIAFDGVVSGTGDLVQAGGGVLSLTGASTHSGATNVLAGTLDVSSANDRLNDQTALMVEAGATFELGATFQDVGSFAGAGVISGAGGTLSAGMDDRSTVFSGSLLVSTVNLSGDGTLILSGDHAVDTLRIANTVRIGAGGWSDLTGTDGPVVQMSGGLLDLDGNTLLIETLEDLAQAGAVNLGDGGVLTLSDGRTQFRGAITGSGELVKDGSGDFTLAGDVAYDGDLTILDGGVVLDAAAVLSGDLALAVSAGAAFDLYDTGQRLTGLSGGGRVDLGAGALELTLNDATFGGDFAGTGDITLSNGSLNLLGDSSAFDGTLTIEDGASLTGSGAIGGLTTIADGGLLSGVQGQTLGLGALVLSEGSTVAAALGAAGDTALFDVAGDLTLDGELEVTDVGGFGAGVYRLFDYGGDLTDNGLDITSTPAGVSVDDLIVQTSVDNQVNLVSTFDVELRFWDTAASPDDDAIQGGAGTWSLTGRGWTGADGAVNGAYDNPAFAVFMGAGGVVDVDGPGIGVTGMQFAVDGYEIIGDSVELTELETIIRVGDGTAAGADMTATIASRLTGAGALVKTDLGTLILTGTNTYEGGTIVRDGTLIGDADSIAGDVVNDATLVFDQGGDADFAGTITGDGLTIKRGGGVLSLLGANAMDWTVEAGGLLAHAGAFSGDVSVASGANFTLNADENAAWNGALSGEGVFTKTGGGGLALNGDSSDFEGVAEISEGLLVLNGMLGGELRILDGAMLAGSGFLADLTADDGAVIAPGTSIGTLTVTGDVVFETGSIYEVEVDPTSDASDRIVVHGTATLNGGTVRHIGYPGGYGPASTYTILTAAGGVTGTFASIETDFAFLDASLDYETNAVLMLLERNDVPFPAVGETFNQRSTGAAVEATGSGDPLYDAVIGQNGDGARMAFDMLSGELHGSIRSAQSEAAELLAGTLSGRMDAARTIETGAAFWAQATGSRTRMASDGNAASLTHGATGLMMGADAGFGTVRLGVAGGASVHDYDNHARAGHAEGDSLSLAAYGSGQWGALGLKGAVSGTWHEVQSERIAAFPGFAEVLTADYDAETIHAFVEASWRVDMGLATTLEPFVNLARVRTESDAFTETGGDAALTVQGRVQAANLATAGVGMSRAYDQGEGRTATLSGRLGWRHAWDDTAGDGRHAFADSPTPAGAFTVRGLPVTEDALVAELGLELDLKDRLSLTVDWSGQLSSDLNANALAATLNWRF